MPSKHTHHHRPIKTAKKAHVFKDAALVPVTSQQALHQAMKIERVSESEYDDLLWIMAQESSGVVDASNPDSSARGLYQLLKPQYSLNPHGENSFGNAVEECQGGIHYVIGRYGSAKSARQFWEKHYWY